MSTLSRVERMEKTRSGNATKMWKDVVDYRGMKKVMRSWDGECPLRNHKLQPIINVAT